MVFSHPRHSARARVIGRAGLLLFVGVSEGTTEGPGLGRGLLVRGGGDGEAGVGREEPGGLDAEVLAALE